MLESHDAEEHLRFTIEHFERLEVVKISGIGLEVGQEGRDMATIHSVLRSWRSLTQSRHLHLNMVASPFERTRRHFTNLLRNVVDLVLEYSYRMLFYRYDCHLY